MAATDAVKVGSDNWYINKIQGATFVKDLNLALKEYKFNVRGIKKAKRKQAAGKHLAPINKTFLYHQKDLPKYEKLIALIEAEKARRKRISAFKRPRMGKTSRSKI